jgi:hypothetical protein
MPYGLFASALSAICSATTSTIESAIARIKNGHLKQLWCAHVHNAFVLQHPYGHVKLYTEYLNP